MKKILIIDIETTAFFGMGGSIVEIGIVSLDLDSGKIEEVFSSLLREKILSGKHRERPFGWIFENSDLTVEAVRAAPEADGVFHEVQKIIDKHPLGCTAFNRDFDSKFLESRGMVIKWLPCPMKLAKNVCQLLNKKLKYKYPKVEEAFHYFYPDIPYIEKHRGADDAKHEAMIVYALYELGVFKIEEE